MTRLTIDNDTQYDFIGKYSSNIEEFRFNKELRDNVLNKLGELEDIEEKLGIDLITLFKVILQGYIFVREHNTEEKEIVAEDVRPNFLTHTFDFKEPRKEIGKGRPFSRIGATWSLTREELENDK